MPGETELVSKYTSDVISSASFLLTAVSLIIVAIAGAHGLWSNYRAKKVENETKRLELWYRLMMCSIGMGDARRKSADDSRWETFVPAQIVGIQSLSAFPEHRDIYQSVEKNLAERARTDADNRNFDQTLYAEWRSMMTRLPRNRNRKS